MSNTTQTYLDLITSEHQGKPDFAATISASVELAVRVQALMASMIPLFDVDNAVGDQLRTLGRWVGVSPDVKVPITGVFFSFDGTDATLGWDQGVWQDPSNPGSITVLPDDSYRTLIKARIAANHWDGTTEGAYVIWNILFPHITLLIQDNQDMSMVIAIVGTVIDSLTLALLTGGYLPLKPEGVHINSYIVPVNTGPLFGWDIENSYIQGWDEGSWGRELAPT